MDLMNLGMFKAYDIRTKAQLLDGAMEERLVRSVGAYLRDSVRVGSVVIARDARLHGPELMQLMVDLFPTLGIDVLVNPLQTCTCGFYYLCMRHPASAGIMITASHNPGPYVGLKLVGPGVYPIAMDCGPDGGITRIKALYEQDHRPKPGSARGVVRVLGGSEEFVDYSLRLAGVAPHSLSGLRIQGEFLSGMAGVDLAMAFDKAGADLVTRHLVPDGFFPAGDPNPIIEPSVEPARIAIARGSFDFGFCFDGDGDRMDLMDGKGRQIVPGFNMAILVPEMKKLFAHAFPGRSWNPQFYADVKAIPLALVEIARAGVGVHIIRNGHSFIKQKLLEHFDRQYLAAEEESAHYYMNFPADPDDWSKGHFATENTLFYALLTAKAWRDDPKKYERAVALQRSFARIREWPLLFDKAPQEMPRIMDEVAREMRRRGAVVIDRMDDGSDLDATLMRFGLPERIDASTVFPERWCQVAQRISRSEDAMTRWEVVASDETSCKEMNDVIRSIADRYVARGYAEYGKQ